MRTTVTIVFEVETSDVDAVEATIDTLLDNGAVQELIEESFRDTREGDMAFLQSDVTVQR